MKAFTLILERISFKHVLALSVLWFSFWVMKSILMNQLPETGEKYSTQILTGMLAMDTTILAFWFNASATEAKKDQTIKTLTEKTTTPVSESRT